jgi:hypothetical protein
MLFGPLSSLDLSRLEDRLKDHGIVYHVEVSKDELDGYAQLRKERTRAPHVLPTFEAVMNYIYIDIPDESVSLVQDELDRLGYGHYEETGDEMKPDPAFDMMVRGENAKRIAREPTIRFVYAVIAAALLAGAVWFVVRELSTVGKPTAWLTKD